MTVLIRIAGWTLLAAFLILRSWLGFAGLAHLLGPLWAVALGALLLAGGWRLPWRVCVFLGALSVWHWPLLAALLIAAPRALLVLPGLISTLLARARHPRPRWRPIEQ
jgi:hypothetical protein